MQFEDIQGLETFLTYLKKYPLTTSKNFRHYNEIKYHAYYLKIESMKCYTTLLNRVM